MPNIQVISRERHAHQRWNRFTTYAFAAQDACIALVAQELPQAMLHMPIAFLVEGDSCVPVAIQGFSAHQNLFVAIDGSWSCAYLPNAYRCYPFSFSESNQGQQILCFDEDSGLLSATQGEAFFDEAGQPSKAVSEVMDFLGQMLANRLHTQRICALLQKHQLIQPWPIQLRDAHGEQAMHGLYRIDEPRLNQLSADVLLELRDTGALLCAYCQLLSTPHLQNLGKLVETRVKALGKTSAHLPIKNKELDLSFLEGRETFKFS